VILTQSCMNLAASLDVNRVPDKREVFVTCEALMLARVRSSLSAALDNVAGRSPITLDHLQACVRPSPRPQPRQAALACVPDSERMARRSCDQLASSVPQAADQ